MATFDLLYTTVQDVIDHLRDYSGSGVTTEALRLYRAAIRAAYREVSKAHHWDYLSVHSRVAISAEYATGTVVYDHTGGSSERLVTLTGGTFPAWAAYGTIILSDEVHYEVDERLSDTTLTLTELSNPGADVSSAAYTLYRDRYALPNDFQFGGRMYLQSNARELQYVSPMDFQLRDQTTKDSGEPTHYTWMGDTDEPSRMMVRILPRPTVADSLDFAYQRRPRNLVFDEHTVGTVTTNGTTALTGSGTAWDSQMAGSIVRISYTSSDVGPDVQEDVAESFRPMSFPRPYIHERRISSHTSSTALTMDESVATLAGVKYVISDPIDFESGLMMEAFLRSAEKQLAQLRKMETLEAAIVNYDRALQLAIQAESKRDSSRAMDPAASFRGQLADQAEARG